MAKPGPAYPDRDAAITARVVNGETMAAVACDYGITRQRVRQIYRRAGMPPVRERQRAMAVERRARKEQGRAARATTRRDEMAAMLDHLRNLAQRLGRAPGTSDLNGPGRRWPASTIASRFGSLSQAQTLAGLRPTRKGESRWIAHGGVTDSVTGWARRLNVPRSVLYQRLRYGWSVERALTSGIG